MLGIIVTCHNSITNGNGNSNSTKEATANIFTQSATTTAATAAASAQSAPSTATAAVHTHPYDCFRIYLSEHALGSTTLSLLASSWSSLRTCLCVCFQEPFVSMTAPLTREESFFLYESNQCCPVCAFRCRSQDGSTRRRRNSMGGC